MTMWVVLVEVESRSGEAMDLPTLRRLADSLEAHPALHNPDRCAVQLRIVATNLDEAVHEALTCLEGALLRLKLPWIAKRVEVFTVDELQRELAAEPSEPDQIHAHSSLQPRTGVDAVAKQLLKDVFTDPVTGLGTRDVLRSEVLDLLIPASQGEANDAVVGIELRGLGALDDRDDGGGGCGYVLRLAPPAPPYDARRPSDTVTYIGSQRFAILLRDVSVDAAVAVARRVLERMARVPVDGQDLALDPISGIALVCGVDADTVLANLDDALSAHDTTARPRVTLVESEIPDTGRRLVTFEATGGDGGR
jgi:hypothetical protein